MLLTESRSEPQHQLQTLNIVQPISECRFYFTLVGWKDAGRAAWP